MRLLLTMGFDHRLHRCVLLAPHVLASSGSIIEPSQRHAGLEEVKVKIT